MKILHTADWHLGKRLERFSRLEEQREVLEEICGIAELEAVDAVIIAGDIYDTFNPASEAVELFYKTVKRLADEGRRAVVAIAGNHDSPDRFAAPEPLARECGIVLSGYPHSVIEPFALKKGIAVTRADAGFLELKLPAAKAPLRLLLTPYANEKRLKTCLGFEDSEEEMRALLQAHWQRLAKKYCNKKGVNLLAAHLFMIRKGQQPPEEPEDEKPILHVGGAQAVYSENLPKQIQYAALGHLHRKHLVSSKPCPVLYSSSPLAYSMSEADQDKYVIIVEAEPGQPAAYREVPLKSGKRLLRERFETVDAAVAWLEAHPRSLVELTLATDDFLTAEERRRLYSAHEGIVAIIPVVKSAPDATGESRREINLDQSMEVLFRDYFRYRHQDQEPPDDLMALFREILSAEEKE